MAFSVLPQVAQIFFLSPTASPTKVDLQAKCICSITRKLFLAFHDFSSSHLRGEKSEGWLLSGLKFLREKVDEEK